RRRAADARDVRALGDDDDRPSVRPQTNDLEEPDAAVRAGAAPVPKSSMVERPPPRVRALLRLRARRRHDDPRVLEHPLGAALLPAAAGGHGAVAGDRAELRGARRQSDRTGDRAAW